LKNYFHIEYFSKTNPKDIKRFYNLTSSQLVLNDLKPKSVYFVQLVTDSEQTSIIFETNDVDSPNSLIVTRADNDKVHVKWNPIEIQDSSVKGYRVYYAEYGQIDYDWKQLDVNDVINTNVIINLNNKKSYVFQVAALDRFNNEGKKSDMVVLYENKEVCLFYLILVYFLSFFFLSYCVSVSVCVCEKNISKYLRKNKKKYFLQFSF
jgi:hypothetical protein